MIRFFRHSYLQQLIAIVLLVFVLWLPSFFSPSSAADFLNPATPLYNVFARLLAFSPTLMKVFALLVFIVSAFLFNSMLSVNLLVTRNSSLGSLMFTILLCFTPEQCDFYPFLLSVPLIMMAIQTLCLLYQEEKSEPYLMNCGVFISIASMILHFSSSVLSKTILKSLSRRIKHSFKFFSSSSLIRRTTSLE